MSSLLSLYEFSSTDGDSQAFRFRISDLGKRTLFQEEREIQRHKYMIYDNKGRIGAWVLTGKCGFLFNLFDQPTSFS